MRLHFLSVSQNFTIRSLVYLFKRSISHFHYQQSLALGGHESNANLKLW